MKSYGKLFILLSVCAMQEPGPAAETSGANSEAARLERLERAVSLLQKENAMLKEELGALKKSHVSTARLLSDGKTVAAAIEEKKPVYVIPAGPEIKLVLGGFIQAQGEFGDVSAFEGRFSGANQINDRFRLRRARINVTGEYAEDFDFKLEGDFAAGDGLASGRTGFSGTDIFINWHHFPEANVKIGQWKAPFGLEQLTPDTILYTIERSLPTSALTPERQVGVQVWGKPLTNVWPDQKNLLTYYAGVFNGNGRNATSNDNSEFMWVGRLELLPWTGKLFGLDSHLKLGADFLTSRDAAETNISQPGGLRVNSDGSLSAFNLPAPDERQAWSVDANFRLGRFDFIGEFLEERVRPRISNAAATTFSSFTANGYYLQGSYFIIPSKLQTVAKWESLNPGQFADDDIRSLTLGLNYYIHGDALKLMANYIHTWSEFREAHPSLGATDFDEVIVRMQVMF